MRNLKIKLQKLIKHLRFIKNPLVVKRILNGYFKTVVLGRNTLRSIELSITYQCQAKCHKCYSANLYEMQGDYLTVEQIRTVINQAMALGIIHVNITGGEPTLRKDILEVIEACRPGEIMVSLVTNALTLTREKMNLLKKVGLNTIQISLDSADQKEHDRLRGVSGCYDKAMAAASWARELGINLCFSTVLSTEHSSNKEEMYKLLALAEREKAFLLICDSAAVGRWEGQDCKMMTCAERNRILEELMRHPAARHHNMYNFRMKVGCPAGIEKIYISAYGDVTPCDLIHDSYGNVLREDLETIWNKICSQSLYSQKTYDCIRYLDAFKMRKLS